MNSNEDAADVSAPSADAARGRVFLLRALATFAALMIYQLSGASARLLDGLYSRFDGSWWPTHLIYIAISLFALGALMLPFSLYEDFILEARETGDETDFEEWTLEILKIIGIDLVAGTGFFLALYGLLMWLPRAWWLVAAVLYGMVNCIIMIVPMLQGPPEDELGELREPILAGRLKDIMQQSGRPAIELLRWHGEGADEQDMLALQGFGKRRRAIISAAMIRNFTSDEIAALLAHETAHLRNFDTARLNVLSFIAALFGFAATHVIARLCSLWFDLPPMGELAAFPVFTCALLAASFAGLPLLNAFSRRREYVADAIAARIAGEIPLCSALEKLNDGGPAAAPATTFDLLLNSHPGLHQRLWRLRGEGRK